MAQEPLACGIITKQSIPEEPEFSDRFGNLYSREELTPQRIVDECVPLKKFKLVFSSAYKDNEIETICKVFKYIEDNIILNTIATPNQAIIDFQKETIPDDSQGNRVLGTGTAIYPLEECGIEHSSIFLTMLGDKNYAGITVGKITLNNKLNNEWHYIQNDPLTGDLFDLYSVVLHEALHVIGFSSRILPDKKTPLPLLMGLSLNYTDWDRHLFDAKSSNKLLESMETKKCCQNYHYNPSEKNVDLAANCTSQIWYKDDLGNLIAPLSCHINNTNGLSHLSNNCAKGNPMFVMHPYILKKQTRRLVTNEESEIICSLGYKTTFPSPKVCEPINLIALDDCDPVIHEIGDNYTINISANDILPKNYTYEIIKDWDKNGLSDVVLDTKTNKLSYTITARGEWKINYKITNTDNNDCATAFLKIICIDKELNKCCLETPCILSCLGDFEKFTSSFEARYYLSSTRNFCNEDPFIMNYQKGTNTIDLLRKGSDYIDYCNGNPFSIKQTIFDNGSPQYLGFWAAYNPTGVTNPTEGFVLPLCKKIIKHSKATVTFFARVDDNCLDQSPLIGLSFRDKIPATGSYEIKHNNSYKAVFINNNKFTKYTVTFNDTGDDDATAILFSGYNSEATAYFNIDDINVTQPNANITIQSKVLKSCANDVQIQYTVCSDNQPVDLKLQATLPVGYSFANGGNFNANGVANIVLSKALNLYCATVTLNLTAAPSAVSPSNIVLTTVSTTPCQLINTTPNTTPVTLKVSAITTAEFTHVVTCAKNGTATLVLTPTYAGDAHTWVVSSSNLTQVLAGSGVNFNALPNGSYTITHTITDDCGNQVTLSKPLEIDCPISLECNCTTSVGAINPISGQTEILLSDTKFYQNNAAPTVDLLNKCMTISGRLIIDKTFNFENGEIIMQPGSEIVVQPTLMLTLTNIRIHSCNKMWRGIYLYSGANVKTYKTLIEDAKYAIRCRGDNSGDISLTKFNKNYVGFYADGIPFLGKKAVNIILSKNEFYCDGNLLPSSNPNENLGTVTYTGILSNFAAFVIGINNLPNSINSFHDIQNGIISYSSVGDINYPRIYKLFKTSPFTLTDLTTNTLAAGSLNHIGIYAADSQWGVHGANIEGQDQSVTKGIHLFQSKGFWMDNSNISAVAGLYNISSRAYLLLQRQNVFSSMNFGVRNFNSANQLTAIGLGGTGIPQNTFLGSSPLIASKGVAVSIEGFTSPSILNAKSIQSNRFSLDSDQDGIIVNKDGNYNIDNNEITYSDAVAPQDIIGIGLQSTSNHRLWGNIITSLANINGTGISMAGTSSNNLYCCNSTNNTNIGINFSGMAGGTRLRNTTFNAHDQFGLWLTSNAQIGVQIHAGNLWVGPFGSNSARFGPSFGNTPPSLQILSASRFVVRNPKGTTVFPNNVFPSTGWFIPLIGTTPTCASDAACQPAPPMKSSGEKIVIPELILAIASQQFLKEADGESNQWEGGRWLLQEVAKHPEWLGISEDLDSYYKWASNSNLQAFNEIDELMGSFGTGSEKDRALLEEVDKNLGILRTQLQQVDEQLGVSKIEAQDSIKYMQLRGEYLERMYAETEKADPTYKSIQEQTINLAADVTKLNAKIATKNIFEKNEQIINAIYLKTLAIGNYNLDKSEQEVVNTLAHQCYRAAGSAVYKARTLYSLFALPNFNDKLCEKETKEVPIYNKVAKNNNINENVVIYPNPASESLTVELPKVQEATIFIRDINGKVLNTYKGNGRISVSTVGIPNGVIFCETFIEGKSIDVQRVVILH